MGPIFHIDYFMGYILYHRKLELEMPEPQTDRNDSSHGNNHF